MINVFLEKILLTKIERPSPKLVRVRAIWGMLISIILACIFLILLNYFLPFDRYNFYGPGLGAPLVPFLIFLCEFITGKKFDVLYDKWDDLKGWQRGILGTVIVIIASIGIVSFCGLIVVFLS